MTKKRLILAAIALIAGVASAIAVDVEAHNSALTAIAKKYDLRLGLPEGGLGEFWPAEVESLEHLPPVVAVVKDPSELNAALGDSALLNAGDFLIFSGGSTGTVSLSARFKKRGNKWVLKSPPESLQREDWAENFFDITWELGLDYGFRSTTKPHFDGMILEFKVRSPEAFLAAFEGWESIEIGADVEVKLGGDDHKLFVAFEASSLDAGPCRAGGSCFFDVTDGEVELRMVKK